MLLSSAYGFAHSAAKVEAQRPFLHRLPVVLEHRGRVSLRPAAAADHQRDHPGRCSPCWCSCRSATCIRHAPGRCRSPTLVLGCHVGGALCLDDLAAAGHRRSLDRVVAGVPGLVCRVVAVAPRPTSALCQISVAARHHLRHGFHRPARLRHHHSAAAVLRRVIRRQSAFTIGLLGTSFSLMQFVFSPVWGRWSDRIGRKPIILVGLLGSCVSYVALALAGSLVADVRRAHHRRHRRREHCRPRRPTSPTSRRRRDRAQGMGMIGTAFGLGFIFGPAIGGVLSRVGRPKRRCGSRPRSASPTSSPRGSCCRNRGASRPRRKALGRMDAFRHAMTQADAAARCCAVLHRDAWRSPASRRRLRCSAKRGSASRPPTIGFVFAFIGVVLAIVQGVLVGRVVKRVGERTPDSAGDPR